MKQSLVIAIITGLLFSGLSGAAARKWKPGKTQQAIDYLSIQYLMPGNEFVIIQWMAPTMLADTPENKISRDMLSKYVMILVAHARVTSLGQWEHTDPSGVVIETGDNKIQQPISDNNLPPVVSGYISTFSQIIAKGMGKLGERAVVMTFDKHGINDCQKGAFWVHYVGERFEYQTPIPGCD